MTLTISQVEHIANLARLDLTDEEKTRIREQLSEVLDYFTRLQKLDTSGIPPTSSILSTNASSHDQTILRADEPRPGLSRTDLFRNAPQTESDQFRVPPVLE